MGTLLGGAVVDRGLFDPAHVNEAAVFAIWACIVASAYLAISLKHSPGRRDWLLLLLGLIMPLYALRYVFFGTRWGSNSSFVMVNLLFTSFCPARNLLPCPDSDPVNCHLTFPKVHHHLVNKTNSPDHLRSSQLSDSSRSEATLPTNQYGDVHHTEKPPTWQTVEQCPYLNRPNASVASAAMLNSSSAVGSVQHHLQDQGDLHFPVLVPLWQIYVRERPLPIYLHTAFMTIAALLWPLLLWKEFRQRHYVLHRRMGYVALTTTAVGSLSAAPYAITYLLSRQLPETVTGLGYLGMYSSASWFLVTGVRAARTKHLQQHQLNMVRLVGLAWGVSPFGRILTVTPPIIWFTGPWNNAAVVCLSWPLGICIAQWWLLHDTEKPKQQET